jgi:hypothetical protein
VVQVRLIIPQEHFIFGAEISSEWFEEETCRQTESHELVLILRSRYEPCANIVHK